MMPLLPLVLTLFTGLRLGSAQDFSYKGAKGPDHWAEEYNTCNGKHQSPINIYTHDVVQAIYPELRMEKFLEQPIEATVINNGHTVVVRFKYKGAPPYVAGGPYGNDSYELEQMHFHWGENDQEGSEDHINDKQFPAESHMVFRNMKYPNYNEAIKHANGVTVLAGFFSITDRDHPGYETITRVLPQISSPSLEAKIMNPPPLDNLTMATRMMYFTYTGSLTTPPCTEDVIWLEFDQAIEISEKQLDRLRHLNDSDGFPLRQNFRPVQPLNNRTIHMYIEFGGIPFFENGVPLLCPPTVMALIVGFVLIMLAFKMHG